MGTIKTVFAIDGETKYKDAIKSINKELALLRAEQRNSAAQNELSGSKQDALKDKMASLNSQIELQKQKIEEAKNAVKQSNEIYGEADTKTQEYKIQLNNAETALYKLQTELSKTNKELLLSESGMKKFGDSAVEVGGKLEKVGKKTKDVGDKLSKYLSLPLAAAGGYSVKAAMDFESAFAGVRKTIDATESQFSELEKSIRDMSKEIPSSAKEIAGVAEAAGQLGIETDNIMGFSRAMIDLGNSTNLSADEAATSLAQFANITQMSQKDFDKLGSSIVALGNNSATTEKDIVNMAQRLAGAGKQVGMSESQIVGISAALASVGIEAEAGGSAFSKVMVNMQLASEKGGKELDDFAKVAGMSSKQFAKAYKEDAAGAITAFVSGLGNLENSGGSAIATLDEMGITETRMRDALLRSAGAGDLMAKSIKLSSDAWKENTALSKEAAERYATNESKLKIAKQNIDDVAISVGGNLLPVIVDMTKGIADAANKFGELSPGMQKAAIIALSVVAGIGPVTKTVGSLTEGIGKATKGIGGFIQKLAEKKAAEAVAKTSTEALSGAMGSKGLVSSLLALGPTGLAVGAVVAGLGAIAVAAYVAGEDARKYNESIVDMAQKSADFVAGIDGAKSALDGFDDSSVWTAENQEKLKKKVDEAQAGISKITELAVLQRRAMTEGEYKRLQDLIDQLGAFADGQIEAYQQKNRILESMAKNEKNMTEQRAQEIIKAAQDTADQIVAIAETQRQKEYQVADDIRQNAIKLRQQKKDKEAEIEEKRAQDVENRADAEYEKTMAAEYKKTADVVAEVQNRYMQQNEVETNNLTRIAEIKDRMKQIEDERSANTAKANKTDKDGKFWSYNEIGELNGKLTAEERSLNKELKDLANQRTIDVGGAMAGMSATVETYGGTLSEKSRKASDGIIAAFEGLPKKQKKIALDAMQGMVDGLNEKEPSLFQKAASLAGGFINKLKEKFEIHSPSRVMKDIFGNVVDTAADTVDDGVPKVKSSAAKMAQSIIDQAERSKDADFSFSLPGIHAFATSAQYSRSALAQTTAVTNNTHTVKQGDITIPIYVDGVKVGEKKISSRELAKEQSMRRTAEGIA